MKKSSKSLILIGTAAIAIGMGGVSRLTTQINRNIQKENIQTYNHKPTSILDNVFMDGNNKILPFIYNKATERITANEIKSEFKNAGLTVKNISTTNIGTGTKVTVNENNDVYTILVYGDVNGDGLVNLIDSQRIILHYLQPRTAALKDVYLKAANVGNADSGTNLLDAQRTILFYLEKNLSPNRLVVNEPVSLKEMDAVKPVIAIKGENPQSVKYGTTYNEEGATATDDKDGNITVQTSGRVNTRQLGSQYITYTAKDSAGNTQTARREIIVKDYATNVTISKNPKTQYQSGNTVDLSGGELQVTYASGATEKISMSQCKANPTTLTTGTSSITISYNSTELFEPITTTLSVTVSGSSSGGGHGGGTVTPPPTPPTKNDITTIKPTDPSNTTLRGYRYANIETILESGEGEKDLVADDIEFEIKKDGIDATKVTARATQEGTKVKMTFSAEEAGIYTVTPKLKGIDGIRGTAITITVEEDIRVNQIILEEFEGKGFFKDKEVVIPIGFAHKYNDEVSTQITTVNAGDITITNSSGVKVTLLDGAKGIIDPTQKPNEPVAFIAIEGTTLGEQNFTVKVEQGELSKTINVKESETLIEVKGLTNNELTLYSELQTGNDMVIQGNDGLIYTLFEINLKQDGEDIPLTGLDVYQIYFDDNAKMQIIDGIEAAGGDTAITVMGYDEFKNEPEADDTPIKYIGIAANDISALTALNGQKITITYPGADPIELTVNAVLATVNP